MPGHMLTDPSDSLERQNEKLRQISEVLMRRVEQNNDDGGAAYALFQRAVMLEDQVRERTGDLEHALDLLNESNARLAEASRETEKARADLANAIETIQEGFALFDDQDRLVLCNSRFGMHMPDIVPGLKPGLTFHDYVDAVSQSDFLHLPDEQTPKGWAEQRIKRHREDHVMFNVAMTGDRWVQVSEHRMAGGQTVIMQTDVSDIIRMERIERSKILDDQARLIRATLEHINQGVCIFDAGRRLVGFNQRLATLLSLPLTQIRTGLDFDLIFLRMERELTFSDGTTPQTILDWVNRTQPRPPLRFEIRRGETQTLDVFAQEMPDKGFVISFSDVSVERQAARALHDANERLEHRVAERTLELEDALAAAERANAARSRFIAAASHDLLQPLSAAKLFLAAIEEEVSSDRQRDTVGKAQNALASVEDIIEALLDISKLESGHVSVELSQVSLDVVLRQLHDEFAPIAALKGVTLRFVPTSLQVETDARYLRRILQNLIANAVRYTIKGRVLVGVRRRRRNVRVEVWDTGPGIPESEHENIFREFHRVDTRASASEGLGLGLAIVERACALLNHPLSFSSQVGLGTTFGVSVPAARTQVAQFRRAERVGSDAGWSSEGLVVLLVENDQDIRRALGLVLEAWDVQVLDVGSGNEAAALIAETQLMPDALLVDFQLDHGEVGTDVVRRLHALTGPIPTRIISAGRTDTMNAACAAIGVDVLFKPLDPGDLRHFLEPIARGGSDHAPLLADVKSV